MSRIRKSHLILGALAIAVVGKTGFLGLDQEGDAVPSFNLVGPALAAGGEEPKKEKMETDAEEMLVCEAPKEVFAEIAHERSLLEAQRNALTEREAKIQLGLDRIDIEAQQLAALKSALEGLIARVETAQNDDVDRLVNLYRNMKPKSAAGIMNELDIESSVIVLGTMAERDAAPILANLDPDRARAISKIILERSKLPGDQDFSGIRLR